MTLCAKFSLASLYNKLSLIFSMIAMLLAWISFVLPAWGFDSDTINSSNWGLWRVCSQYSSPSCIDLTGWTEVWYGAVQALVVLAFVGINVAFFLILLQIFVDKCYGISEIAFWNFVQIVVTSICYLVAIIVFGVMFDDLFAIQGRDEELGYSWILAIIALAFNGIAVAILQFLEGREADRSYE